MMSPQHAQLLEEEVSKYIQTGVLVPVTPEEIQAHHARPFFLKSFPVPKKSGGLRLTTDWRPLNAHCWDPEPFKMFTIPQVKELLSIHKEFCWATKVDLKDAYNHLRMQKFAGQMFPAMQLPPTTPGG